MNQQHREKVKIVPRSAGHIEARKRTRRGNRRWWRKKRRGGGDGEKLTWRGQTKNTWLQNIPRARNHSVLTDKTTGSRFIPLKTCMTLQHTWLASIIRKLWARSLKGQFASLCGPQKFFFSFSFSFFPFLTGVRGGLPLFNMSSERTRTEWLINKGRVGTCETVWPSLIKFLAGNSTLDHLSTRLINTTQKLSRQSR